jgi:hypothetical protein
MFQDSAANPPALSSSGAARSLMSQVRAAPAVDSDPGDGSLVRRLEGWGVAGGGAVGSVAEARSDRSVAGGVGAVELGEVLTSGAGPCWPVSSLNREPRMPTRLVEVAVELGEADGVAVGAGTDSVPVSAT